MNGFTLGVSHWVLWDYGLVRAINLAYRIGFKAFELLAEPRVIDPLSVNLNLIENLRLKFYDLGLRVSVHAAYWDVNLASLNPHIRRLSIQFAKATLLMAKLLNASVVVIHPGEASAIGMSEGQVERLTLQSLEEIVDYAMDIGAKVAIENMEFKSNRYTFCSPQDINSLIDSVESLSGVRVGLALNIAHASTVMDPVEYIDELDVDILHVYVSDVAENRLYLPIGDGILDFEEIFRCLYSRGFEGLVIVDGYFPKKNFEIAQKGFENLSEVFRIYD